MTIKEQITQEVAKILEKLELTEIEPKVDYPADPARGDYSTNVALVGAKKLGKNPMELAEEIAEDLRLKIKDLRIFEKVEVVKPGFINFWISNDVLTSSVTGLEKNKRQKTSLTGKKMLVEYAHPNTHKEIHIGHMRTLITGEAISRLLEAAGAEVFRANYQGDIGPHVAKAIFGIQKIMDEKGLTVEEIASWTNHDKAHFLGEGYARGSKEYEGNKEEVDLINKQLYQKDSKVNEIYQITRKWSLDYYDDFYKRFYTKFDELFFESDVADRGKEIVQANIGKIFKEENDAVIFPGEKYGLHTRVFITSAGNPTYEGKEMANGFAEYKAFPFDKKIHVVGSEQAGYFQVVFKALELLDSDKFENKQIHISMGMVQLTDRKMSSRTGDVLTVDWLIDQVKNKAEELMSEDKLDKPEREKVLEQIAIGAIKYSVLQVSATQNVTFDINKSVSLDGNSGPYIQYVYARTQSVLAKSEIRNTKSEANTKYKIQNTKYDLQYEEREILRLIAKFDEVVQDAAERFAPNIVCTYLFELAQAFNLFYQKCPIIKSEEEIRNFRLALTFKTGETIKHGLNLLGIEAPVKM